MKKTTTFLLTVIFSAIISASPALAQQASDSAESADSSEVPTTITIEKRNDASDETDTGSTQILKNLESLVRDTTQSEQIKSQYDDVATHARGFIGQVTSVKEDAFKITTQSGEELLIAPDKSTTLVKKGEAVVGNTVNLAEWINVDDWLVLIGIQSGETFQPRRILVSADSLEPSNTFVERGIIRTSQSNKLDIDIVGAGLTETFNLTKNTNLVDQDNETIGVKDLPAGTQVLLIGKMMKDKRDLQTLRLI